MQRQKTEFSPHSTMRDAPQARAVGKCTRRAQYYLSVKIKFNKGERNAAVLIGVRPFQHDFIGSSQCLSSIRDLRPCALA